MKIYALTAALLAATPASADISARFTESAPKDSFTFTNTGACDIGPATLTLNLSRSAAGLIFDTTGSGAGVEVFQPYQTVAGADLLAGVTPVKDGDTVIALTLNGLGPAQSVGFTIDVDDTQPNSSLGQIRVSDSEIAGATVALKTATGTASAVFDTTSRATIATKGCAG